MSFLNPLFLFGLAAAAIPILIHLFTRRKPREVQFSSLEFLSEVNQSEIRRLKLKQWLLLLLRTLAVAALALAMARPALRGTAGLTGDAATSIVVLLDRSGSMAAEAAARGPTATNAGPAGTLFARATRLAEDLLASMGPGDELLLVPYDAEPQPLTTEPIADLPRLRSATQALTVSANVTAHEAALRHAARALAASRALNRELFWISDFQRAGTDSSAGARFAAPDGPWAEARVYLIPLEPRARSNVALSDGTLAPTEGGLALSVTAVARGATPGDLAVEARDARAGATLGRGFLNLPADGETSTLLPLERVPEEGGLAEIPPDALPLDNRRFFAAGRAGTQRIVLREDAGPSAVRFALEAGSPASGLAINVATAATLATALRDADALVLNDLERLGAAELQAVLDYHRAGGAIFLVLGERSDAAFWNASVLRPLAIGTLGETEETTPTAAWRLMRATAGHPALAGFPARPGEPLSQARFRRIRGFRVAPDARTLLEYDRAHPALIEGPRVFTFAGSLDPAASDFPVSGAFLPLIHQVVKVLGRGTAAPSLVPGDVYSTPATTGEWRIEDQDGRAIESDLVAASGITRLVSAALERPGLYRVLRGTELRSTFAVNMDTAESDLARMPDQELLGAFPAGRARIMQPGADLAARVREARFGRELWSWFVMLALALLVAEMVLARAGMAASAPGASARGPRPAA